MTSFNAILFFLGAVGGRRLRKLFPSQAGGAKIWREGMRTRVRLSPYSALDFGVVVTAAISLMVVFIVGFSSGLHPSLEFAGVMLSVAYGSGLAEFRWGRARSRSGREDLIINNGAHQVELALTLHRKERVVLTFSEISAITMEDKESTDSDGYASFTYAPTVHLRDINASGETAGLLAGRNHRLASSTAGLVANVSRHLKMGKFDPK